MSDDLPGELESWGATPAPGPDPAFTRSLEADLRSQAYFGSGAPAPERRRPLLRPALLVFSSIAILFGAVVFLRSGAPEELIMTEAISTRVSLPDDTTITGAAGLALPDGTRISVDVGGSAVIDGIVLGGGTEALVLDGRLEVLVTQPTTPPPPDVVERPTATATPRRQLARTPTPRPTAGPTARPEATPVPTATARPADPTPTAAATASPTPVTDRPRPTDRPAPTPTVTPEDDPPEIESVDVDLAITPLDGARALLAWTVSPADPVGGWEIVLITGDGTRTLAVLRDPSVRELRVEEPAGADATFRVRARAPGGTILGESNSVGFPSGD